MSIPHEPLFPPNPSPIREHSMYDVGEHDAQSFLVCGLFIPILVLSLIIAYSRDIAIIAVCGTCIGFILLVEIYLISLTCRCSRKTTDSQERTHSEAIVI